MPFKPGISGNPNGRPKGTFGPRKIEEVVQESLVTLAEHVAEQALTQKPRTAIEILLGFANDSKIATALRISAASAAAPYVHSRKQATPVPIYVAHAVGVPDFETIEDAESFLLNMSQKVAAGELDLLSAEQIATRIREWISSCRQGEELELKRLAATVDPNPTIRIEGGLPPLPGCDIIMPELNQAPAIESEPNILSPPNPEPADPAK
jgi:hypothetical protein